VAATRLLALVLLAAACTRSDPERPEVGVWAAASLRDALAELAPSLEAASGAEIVLNLGSSTDLARQILAGAPADVFLSADPLEMDRLEAEGLVEPGTRRPLLTNQLVVVVPSEGDSLSGVAQLAGPTVRRLSIGDPRTVPAGRYARKWLESEGIWSEVSARVLPAVDVRAALAAVESGTCEAGIVYLTDAARSGRVRVVHVVPIEEGPAIRYAAAVLAGRPRTREARALLACLSASPAGEVFRRHGFEPLPSGSR
jgi:molybdate transport system substrate-binding protein